MARREKTIHYLYKTTCLITNRYYIGMHSTNNMEDGYMGSGIRLRRSIRKYGVENHIKEILEFFTNREELSKREKEIITFELINENLCMNLVAGGNGGYISKEGVKKGRKVTNEKYIDKLSEWSSKGGLTNFKKNGLNENFKKNRCDWSGKKHTEESIKKISEKAKLRIGEKSSQYGTCWVTNGSENKKIKKTDDLPDGWVKGRKINN